MPHHDDDQRRHYYYEHVHRTHSHNTHTHTQETIDSKALVCNVVVIFIFCSGRIVFPSRSREARLRRERVFQLRQTREIGRVESDKNGRSHSLGSPFIRKSKQINVLRK